MFLDTVEGVCLFEPLGQHKHRSLDEDGPVITNLELSLGECECPQTTDTNTL